MFNLFSGIYPCNKNKYPLDRLNPDKLKLYYESNNPRNYTDLGDPSSYDSIPSTSVAATKELQIPHDDFPSTSAAATNQLNIRSDDNIPSRSIAATNQLQNSSLTSFESILLEKINKTAAPNMKRRKIDSSAKVLTNEEFSNLVRKKEEKREKKATKPKATRRRKVRKIVENFSESSESEGSVICEDESDYENMTLADIVENEIEDLADIVEDEIEDPVLKIKAEDFILVRFRTKKKTVHYIGQVHSVPSKDEYNVKFLRRKGQSGTFVFPKIEDNADVSVEDIVLKLPPPAYAGTERTNGQYIFPIDFNTYVVC